jgi:hypothetical protein
MSGTCINYIACRRELEAGFYGFVTPVTCAYPRSSAFIGGSYSVPATLRAAIWYIIVEKDVPNQPAKRHQHPMPEVIPA